MILKEDLFMNTDIGHRIKELRKSKKITQEQLADTLGISFQAVSKWECGISLPDIMMVPVIAAYFGVTTDELFSFDLRKIKESVEAIVNEAYKYRCEEDFTAAENILRDGLKKFPDNDILLNNLLYTLNSSRNDETIEICQKLISETDDDSVKYDAMRFLAYAYKKNGDIESMKATLELIPEIYFTKIGEKAFLVEGEEKKNAADKQKWISFEYLIQMNVKLYEYYKDAGNREKAIDFIKCSIDLLDLMERYEPEILTKFDNYRKYLGDCLCK